MRAAIEDGLDQRSERRPMQRRSPLPRPNAAADAARRHRAVVAAGAVPAPFVTGLSADDPTERET